MRACGMSVTTRVTNYWVKGERKARRRARVLGQPGSALSRWHPNLCPAWFIAALPTVALDGEPWLGHKRFDALSGRPLEIVVQAQQPWLHAVAQQRVRNAAALHTLLRKTLKAGGEGLVLHRANALWSPGRSDALLKLKLHADDEARVVAHVAGKGKHAGRLGALLLEMPDGKRFALGTGFTNAQRENPPPVGAVVTYRYRDLSPKGLPRAAVFVRVRGVE